MSRGDIYVGNTQDGFVEIQRKRCPMYVLNVRKRVVHDEEPSERCNTDQLTSRRRVSEVPLGSRFCRWCYPKGAPLDAESQ
jgi:hypothetical protein